LQHAFNWRAYISASIDGPPIYTFRQCRSGPRSGLGIQADRNDLPRMQWLIQEGGATVNATYEFGTTSLLLAAQNPGAGGARGGHYCFRHLRKECLGLLSLGLSYFASPQDKDAPKMVLLRTMLLKAAPPANVVARLCSENLRVVRGCGPGSPPTSHSGGSSWKHTVRCWHHSGPSSLDTKSPRPLRSSGPRGSARLRDSLVVCWRSC
jgi:hypothetical protein